MPPPPESTTPPPAKPVIRAYPTPDLRDRIYVEARDARLGGYKLPEQGAPYEGREAPKYEGWVFATAVPSDKIGWTDHYYLNERLNQDAYNFSIEYPWVDKEYPRYTRTYVFLRSDFVEPCPHEPDPKDDRLVLVSWKLDRSQDPVIDSLFIGVTKIYERVPAPTKVTLDRPDHILPFNQRVAVPLVTETTVQEDATDGSTPEIVNHEDWTRDETTDTAFRKTVVVAKRVIPPQGSVLESTELTREQQVASVISTWKVGIQTVDPPRARVIESKVDNVGNDTSVKETRTVPYVYPRAEHEASIPDTVPQEFRDLLPIRTTAINSEGKAAPPDLAPGELERKSEQVTDVVHRETVTGRDLDQLPKTLVDQLIDGIPAHGSTFGGVFDKARTLARGSQDVEEGFGIIASSVRHLGSGLTARETERLSTLVGASLLLTGGGDCYFCDPAVVFDAGVFGSGAAGTAILSTVPGGTGDPGQDPGGTFILTYTSDGDANGVFYMLGARYNNGTWRNPATAENIQIFANGNPAYPVSPEQLAGTVDRAAGPMLSVIPVTPGGGHYVLYDLGVGRKLVPNKVSIRTNPASAATFHRHARVQGFNNIGETPTTLGDITLPAGADTWVTTNLAGTTAYRYLWLFGTDGPIPGFDPPVYPSFGFGEIEFYGTLTIQPGVVLNYVYNGDANGVFFYLGRRGGGGNWRNPQTNGDIIITADGLANGTLDEIVDRQPSNVYDDASGSRAFYFDLKDGTTLVCSKMSFRQRTQFGSGTNSFNLQGRNDVGDPGAWVDLATVFPSQTPDTWTTIDVNTGTAYRQFRIISPEPYFTIGEFELYGELALAPPSPVSTYSVTSVEITNGGSDYITPPEVHFTGGAGSGAAGTAVLTEGAVTSVTMTNGGTGYTSAPTVSFHVRGGGEGAAATAAVSGGSLTGITVDDPGTEYTAAPLVQIVGVGTGATAHSEISSAGEVTAVIIDTVGTGYSVAPTVVFHNVGSPEAVARVGFGLQDISVTNRGSNYTAPPAVQIVGDGNGATAAADIGFDVGSVVIDNRGHDYVSDPAVVFGGTGSGAAGTPTRGFPISSVDYFPNATLYTTPPVVAISGGGQYGQDLQLLAVLGRSLLAFIVSAPGSGYTSNPAVAVSGDGSGATGHSVRSFALASIAVGAGGAGYASTPSILIAAPTGNGGTQATAHAEVTAGAVTGIVIDNPGRGYLTAPNVSISGGGGAGATATATLASAGQLDSIVLDTVGQDYTAATVAITGGGGTSAAAIVTLNTSAQGHLLRIDIVNAGSGYTSAPTLSVTGGTTPVAHLSSAGQIVAVTITNVGTGYTGPIPVTFTGGGGAGASGTAYLTTTGGVIRIRITNPGRCYTTPPEIIITGGGGSDATAVAVLLPTGSVCSLTLTDPGPEYTVPPIVSFEGCWEGA